MKTTLQRNLLLLILMLVKHVQYLNTQMAITTVTRQLLEIVVVSL